MDAKKQTRPAGTWTTRFRSAGVVVVDEAGFEEARMPLRSSSSGRRMDGGGIIVVVSHGRRRARMRQRADDGTRGDDGLC